MTTWTVAATVANSICLVLLLIMNLSLIRSTIQHFKINGMSSFIALSLVTTLAFMLSITILLIASSSSISASPSVNSVFIGLIGTSMYFVSQSLMLLLFTIRIDVTFRGTVMAINSVTIKCLYIFTIILLVLSVFTVITYGVMPQHVTVMGLMVWSLLHFVLSVILVVLFIQRIDKMLMIQIQNRLSNVRSASVVSQTSSDDRQRTTSQAVQHVMESNELSYVVIKHALLVPIAIISTFICIVCSTVVSMYVEHDGHFMAGCIGSIDSLISTFCIYLLFAFNKDVYTMVCSPLHTLCSNRKANKIEKSTQRKDSSTATATQQNSPDQVVHV
eukprot:86928_1